MPIIIPRVNPTPLPPARMTVTPLARMTPIEAFGGGAGDSSAALDEGLSPIHQQAAQIAQEEKQKADSIANTANSAAITDAATQTLYGPDGALTKQGANAFTAPEDARTTYYQKLGAIRSQITDAGQRDAFDGMAARQWSEIDRQVQAHVAQQRQAYDDHTTDAAIANYKNLAIQGYSDAPTVQNSIDGIKQQVANYGQRNGWSADEIQQITDKHVSDTHVGVLSRMLDAQQIGTAQSYYDAHKDAIDGSAQEKIDKALKTGTTQAKALHLFNDIINGNGPNGPPVTATAALAKAEDEKDPATRQEALQLVTSHFNEVNRAQQLDRENARNRVQKDVEDNGGKLNKASSDWQLIDGTPEGFQVLERQHQILFPPRDPGDPDKVSNYIGMAVASPDTRAELLATPISTITNDDTMNAAQKTRVINFIRGEKEKDYRDLVQQSTAADKYATALEQKVKNPKTQDDVDNVDENTSRMYAAQQKATVLRGQLQQAQRARRSAPSQSGAHAPANGEQNGQSGQQAPSVTSNDVDTSKPKPLTPEIIDDIAKYGPGYLDVVRAHGYDVSRYDGLPGVRKP